MTLKESLMTIKDFRIDRCKKHNLCDILMIVLIGHLTGCKDFEEIHFTAEIWEERLKKYLELPNGIPSADTILRVLAGIDGKELERVLAVYARETFGSQIPEKEIIAIDGKTIKRSAYTNHNDESKSHKAAHVVSAFASSMEICFGQVKTEEKSNEITAIPELLDLLEIKGLIVTIDAMGCQKKIAEKIIEKKADYLFSLKGNQEKIHEDVKDFFNHELDEKYRQRYKIQSLSCEVEKDHGRIEKRDYYLCTNLKWLAEKDEWKNLGAVGMVRSHRMTNGSESTEFRYFITSLKDVRLAAKAMRSHWSIENNLHWVLDTVFDEDYCRVRKIHNASWRCVVAQNLNIIRKLVMNLLKGIELPVSTKKKNLTIGNKQTLCSQNEKCLLYALQQL